MSFSSLWFLYRQHNSIWSIDYSYHIWNSWTIWSGSFTGKISVQRAQSLPMVRMVKSGERSYIERSWTMRGLILKRGSWGEAGEAWGTEGHIEIGSWRRVFRNQKSKCQTMDSDQTWLCRPLFKQCSVFCCYPKCKVLLLGYFPELFYLVYILQVLFSIHFHVVNFHFLQTGVHFSLDVLPSWADRGSCAHKCVC